MANLSTLQRQHKPPVLPDGIYDDVFNEVRITVNNGVKREIRDRSKCGPEFQNFSWGHYPDVP